MSDERCQAMPAGSSPRAGSRPPVREDERGVTILWFTFFMLLSLGFVALGIDVAKLAATRTQLQNAADASALAAASAVDFTTGHLIYNTALARAQETGMLNKAFVLNPEQVVVNPEQVVLLNPNTVQVTVERTGNNSIVAQFAQVLGLSSFQLHATAVARAESSNTVQCILPVGVKLNPGETFSPGCGNRYTLKYGPGAGTRGNYGYLSLPKCASSECQQPGSNPHQLACLIENGFCCGLRAGDLVDTAPGNKAPAIDGFGARFSSDTDARPGICYSDYRGNGKRVVTVPMLSSIPNGAGTVSIEGFASFFLNDKPAPHDAQLSAEFVYVSAAGSGGGKPASGAVTYSAHLVR